MDGPGVAHPDTAPGLPRDPRKTSLPRGPSPRASCAGARLGLPRDLVAADGAGNMTAGSVGAVAVGAACGIAGFQAVCLTDMVRAPNRINQEFQSAATARSAPWLQRRGGGAVTLLHRIALRRTAPNTSSALRGPSPRSAEEVCVYPG